MNIIVFDTETTSLEKPFVYDIGYIVYDTEAGATLVKRSFVVEQVWHNMELFTTAYYAEKRKGYVNAMRSRKMTLAKYGAICRQMYKDITDYDITTAYAYNSVFDDKVFDYNCEWFKTINPFDSVKILDIRGYVHQFIVNDTYRDFCEKNQLFTESGNYSTTAETVYRFICSDTEFEEAHTALNDAEIELDILKYAIDPGAEYGVPYQTLFSVGRNVLKELTITDREGDKHIFKYAKIRINGARTDIKLT